VTPFCLIFINDQQSIIYHRGLSLSSCRCSYLEQFTPARHFYTFVACLPVTPQDSSFYYFLPQSVAMYTVQCLSSDTCHFRHFNRSCYLLTYLLGPRHSFPCHSNNLMTHILFWHLELQHTKKISTAPTTYKDAEAVVPR